MTASEQLAADLNARRHGVTMRGLIRRTLARPGGVTPREIKLYLDGIEFRLTQYQPESERRAWAELAEELEALA